MEPLIRLRNLEKSYDLAGGKYFVLRRITLDIEPREFVTVMGPSGAGKSTLLSILGMLDGAWSGEYFSRQPVQTQCQAAQRHKANVGFVFQSYHLIDNLTVYENLEIPLSHRNIHTKSRSKLVATLWIISTLSARKICSQINSPADSNN
jgi:ABC-type lipoprotein export system ATPase subunit